MPTTVALSPFPVFYDDFGNPLTGGKVYTYAAGTVTPKQTWQDRDGLVLNSNPVVLDAAGRADIWLTLNEPYDIAVMNADESQVIRDVLKFYGGADPEQLVAAGTVPASGGAYTGPVDFTGGATFSGTTTQDTATLDSLNIAAAQTANLLHNPEFFVNQRGANAAADGAIGFDRWGVLCESGSVSLSSIDTATLTLAGNALRLTQPDASAKRIGLVQVVEAKDCLSYRGKNLVLAAQVRCSASATIRCALVAWTGTQDAPTRDLVNNWSSTNFTASNFFIPNTLTIGTASVAAGAATWVDILVSSTSAGGVPVPASMKNLYAVFWSEGTLAQNVTLDVASPRVGLGSQAPRWTSPVAQEEIAKCRRFLPGFAAATGAVLGTGMATASTQGVVFFTFDVPARASITGMTSGGAANLLAPGGTQAISAFVFSAGSIHGGACLATVTTGLTSGHATLMLSNSSNTFVYFTGAEL